MTNETIHCLSWRRKWNNRDWAVAAAVAVFVAVVSAGFAVFMISASQSDSRSKGSNHHPTQPLSPFAPLPANPSAPLWVPLTLLRNANKRLRNANKRGAFCLDGSLPGYHLQKGFGSGSNNWVLHLEGGGWCGTIKSCSSRKRIALGSSRYMDRQVEFGGILSPESSQNPDFFNWNKVKIRYCDGASFAGNPGSEFKNGTELFFRGQLIWEAVMDELLLVGLSNAREALLSGCSAGGLATLIHCDGFRKFLPKDATVKCLSDAGFFLNEKDIAGHRTMKSFFQDVVHLQGVAKSLDKDCVARMEPSMCFFPQEFINNIKTPVFLVQAGYDYWQVRKIFVPDVSDPHGNWAKCKLNIHNCNSNQIEVLQGYRNSLLKILSEFLQNKEGGVFINSCFAHCQTFMAEGWHSSNSPRINNKTIAESVGDWFFNRNVVKRIDCPFPCNPTCNNIELARRH